MTKKSWALLLVALWLPAVAARAGDDTVSQKFSAFCGEWMQKLAARERDNRAAIKWQNGSGGVLGEFVGYSSEHRCVLKEPATPNDTPIGKITYRELLYRQKGGSEAEAASSVPQAVEATEVTEIFRYTKGKWVY